MPPRSKIPPSPLKDPYYEAPEDYQIYADRFYDQVVRPDHIDMWVDTEEYFAACWPWVGKVDRDNQGFIYVRSARIPIHRYSYILQVGPVPDGLYARPMACGLKLCVAPHHLRLMARGGELRRKLSREEEDTIRKFFHYPHDPEYSWSADRLAKMFKVSQSTILRVVHRKDS